MSCLPIAPFPQTDPLPVDLPPRSTREEKPGLPSIRLFSCTLPPPDLTGILILVCQVSPGSWEVCVWCHLCKSSSCWMTYRSMLLCYDSSYMY
ncbi:hypothetical protein BDP81DRAFT_37245 [Colletotrichum phormii]|uniref:Uncharacterized protein n=1 Tax=Colletotrichum phormii TaxID=359342 RepID=A0AAI9ZQL4_9PEZI|nr:uncharacterized protein BDP81DRAFT_37245 [Colletotrichum phormii]KAK1636376.1 hypothetical protein BDP81DRAFT_37245 [Colletotrichum phormii]